MIGKSVVIRGDVSGSEDLFVDGRVEGTVTLADGRLTVGPNAQVVADVKATEVTVFGRVEGNIHGRGRVELRKTAVVHGNIFATRLSVEESAVVKGKIDLTPTGAGAAPPRPA